MIVVATIDSFDTSISIMNIIWIILVFMYGLNTGYIVSLMLSHNDDKYVKFMQIVDIMRIFCCFKWFINIASLYSVAKELENNTPRTPCREDITYDDHDVVKKIEIELSATSKM